MTVGMAARTRESYDSDTPFLRFWSAVNDQRENHGLTLLTYGPASRLWNATWHRSDAEPVYTTERAS